MADWDKRFLDLAGHIATWSKDPSTKVGAVIVNHRQIVVGLGYNGFPRGVVDSDFRLNNREEKYPRSVHAEANAILNSSGNLEHTALFCTHCPCSDCAKLIIQSGISFVMAPLPEPQMVERWGKSFELTKEMFKEADVELFLT